MTFNKREERKKNNYSMKYLKKVLAGFRNNLCAFKLKLTRKNDGPKKNQSNSVLIQMLLEIISHTITV